MIKHRQPIPNDLVEALDEAYQLILMAMDRLERVVADGEDADDGMGTSYSNEAEELFDSANELSDSVKNLADDLVRLQGPDYVPGPSRHGKPKPTRG